MNELTEPDPTPQQDPGTVPRPAGQCIDSDELLGGANVVGIRHRGELYRLRITRQGKLILTK